ncbi:MAG: AmmeMemoRadiSam system protein B [Acidobacteria bacterium]|nr:AmmeMemoRadiSam system protein B [Acidobacteriota bacterium]
MPSPVADRPGLLIRDPFRYTDATLIIPPLLARLLALFDGQHSELDLRAALTQMTGDLQTGELAKHLVDTLDDNGFLQSPTFEAMREKRHKEFAEATERMPAHAGSAYPDEAEALRATLAGYGAPAAEAGDPAEARLLGIAAPHVSPEGGYQSYAAAYRRLRAEHADKTFVILGTSHYGEPETFGLTRKAYLTPLGPVETDVAFVDELAQRAGASVAMEDFCHSSEHSIEFQSVFLQGRLGPHLPEGERLRAVPILCGALAESLWTGKPPETNDKARRFFEALAETASQRDDVIWVLGVDMAHIGRRYGDNFDAITEKGVMADVRRRDEERLERLCAGDSEGFFELMRPKSDDLRWCGYGPMYTFLQCASTFTGRMLNYEQWNIDPKSVVTFVGAEMLRAPETT